MQPNVEVIARLQPDLVIVQTLPNSVRSQLDALHIPTAEVDTGSLSQNLEAMIAIGKAAGAEASARQLVGRIRQKLTDLRAGSHKGTTPSAAFIVGRTPGKLDGLVAVGGGSYLSELIERAGGRNVFADAAQPYIKVSMETILRRDPTVLIDMGDMAETVGITQATKDNVVRLWSSQGRLSAVRQHRVYAVAADIFVVPGPRMLDAAQAFATMLHPETTR
jgi:iron complex transport system substrate-binding protein